MQEVLRGKPSVRIGSGIRSTACFSLYHGYRIFHYDHVVHVLRSGIAINGLSVHIEASNFDVAHRCPAKVGEADAIPGDSLGIAHSGDHGITGPSEGSGNGSAGSNHGNGGKSIQVIDAGNCGFNGESTHVGYQVIDYLSSLFEVHSSDHGLAVNSDHIHIVGSSRSSISEVTICGCGGSGTGITGSPTCHCGSKSSVIQSCVIIVEVIEGIGSRSQLSSGEIHASTGYSNARSKNKLSSGSSL